jgi:hypothetical protein
MVGAQIEAPLLVQQVGDFAIAVEHRRDLQFPRIDLLPVLCSPFLFHPAGSNRIGRHDQQDRIGVLQPARDCRRDIRPMGNVMLIKPRVDLPVDFQKIVELADKWLLVLARMRQEYADHGLSLHTAGTQVRDLCHTD